MVLLTFYITLALLVSFFCSLMESVLLSTTPTFVAQLEKERPYLGQRLRRLKEDIDRPLAAILSLNTIAHTVGAAGAGAQAVAVFGEVYLGIASAIITLLILVLSEIVPKTLGAVYWRQLTPSMLHLLMPTIWLMWPLVRLSQVLTKLFAAAKQERVSRGELAALAELGVRDGVVHESESRVVANLLQFDQIRVRDIMTPRTVVVSLPEASTVSEVLTSHPKIRFSRIPVYDADADNVTGFVLKVDLLFHALEERGDTPLVELRRPLAAVPLDLPLRKLFDRLISERAHLALVVDEYGGTAGVVTLEDLMETLLGLEIVDEADTVQDMRELARRKWLERARRLGIAPEREGVEHRPQGRPEPASAARK